MTTIRRLALVALVGASVFLPAAAHGVNLPSRASLITGTPASLPANGATLDVVLSDRGREAAFTSTATDLGPLDGNGDVLDVVVVSIADRAKRLVSVGPLGEPADGPSFEPAISGDGSTVAFSSFATNLAVGDTNGVADVFAARGAGPATLVSVGLGGAPANGPSRDPSLSADGRLVVFTSEATNLVPGDDNKSADVFVRDLISGRTAHVSVGADEPGDGRSDSPAISSDGRYVTFASDARNLDPRDSDRITDVFLRDRTAGRTELISVSRESNEGQRQSFNEPFRPVSDVSADGRFVVFDSPSSQLTLRDRNRRSDVFVRDRRRKRTDLVSAGNTGRQGNNDSVTPVITDNGRFVAFQSFASNLALGGTAREDLFVHDRRLRLTSVVDVPADGSRRGFELGNQNLQRPSISSDGQLAGFTSSAANVSPPDANRLRDGFVRFMAAPATRVSVVRRRGRSPAIRITADDPRARYFVYRIDGGPPKPTRPGTLVLRGLKPGRHRIAVYAGGAGMLFDPTPVRTTVTVTR